MSPTPKKHLLGKTGLHVPQIIFGTSCLGNLYQPLPHETKRRIVQEWFAHVESPVVLDSAGKYGAGMALDELGECLRELGIEKKDVILSNKLGWKRIPLTGTEPTFEPGVWKNIRHDAQQCISYEGIIECYQQGCALLGEEYSVQLASVHDPDEYLAAASNADDRAERLDNILGAYRALKELKHQDAIRGVGVGAKDWRVIRELADHVDFDWVMFACSLTPYHHPQELLAFMEHLHQRNIGMINSAVFNAGFLIGGEYFDYVKPSPLTHPELFQWRDSFVALCRTHDVSPSVACVQFGLSVPGVVAIALNTSKPQRVKDNVRAFDTNVPNDFWAAMKEQNLIARDFPYLG